VQHIGGSNLVLLSGDDQVVVVGNGEKIGEERRHFDLGFWRLQIFVWRVITRNGESRDLMCGVVVVARKGRSRNLVCGCCGYCWEKRCTKQRHADEHNRTVHFHCLCTGFTQILQR